MHNQPNPDDRLAQKGTVSRSIGHNADGRSLTTRPGRKREAHVLKSREMDMRNRVTRLTLSRNGAGNQPQAQTGEIAQEANAFGKAEGYADVGRVYGKSSAMEG